MANSFDASGSSCPCRGTSWPDCDPVRVQVLGEHLVLSGTLRGAWPGGCLLPHRGAPMFFGRNEECGLRCVYHGWKFDVHGDCVDMPMCRRARLLRPR